MNTTTTMQRESSRFCVIKKMFLSPINHRGTFDNSKAW